VAPLLEQAKDLEQHIGRIVSNHDIDSLENKQRQLLTDIKRIIVDARLDTRDYEYAETRAEQLKFGKIAVKRFETLRKMLVKASEYNLFSAVDIAQLSAHIEQLISQMTEEA